MKNHKKLIVFDWNGTLLSDTIPSWKASNICLEFYGAPPISLARFRETFNFPVLKFYEDNGVSAETVLERKDEGNQAFQSAYERLAAKARTRKGAHDLLQNLNKQGHECMILSNYITEKIEGHLQRLSMRGYFAHVNAHTCDGTTILQSTTKTLRLREYMRMEGASPEDTIIIGDSIEEPEIARALGITSIGITGGAISTARLKAAAPDYIVSSLWEIKRLIKTLGAPIS
ncbi:MAG: HAD family hydrolase [Alphaproteobacteria bacterium]|nr:HAD family hydrolase [Alphaproteobacteria bacterium]